VISAVFQHSLKMPTLTVHARIILTKLLANLNQLLLLPLLRLQLLLVQLLMLVNVNGSAKHQQELLHQLLNAQVLELQ
jgi:hypothetical protein